MKPYSYYVYHAMRAYFAGDYDEGNYASRENYRAAKAVLEAQTKNTVLILQDLYTSPETLKHAVALASKKYDIPKDTIWTQIAMIEKRFAEERGLI